MKNTKFRIMIIFVLVSLLLLGCTGGQVDDLSEQEVVEEEVILPIQEESPAENVQTEELPPAVEVPTEPARFTIMTDTNLQDVIIALYGAMFAGENPNFVEEEPDLIATYASSDAGDRPILQATFLPDIVFIPESNNEDVSDFIEFAISPDGQQILIDMGTLPETLTITDQAGNLVEVPQPLRRVISAYGPATSIVYAISGWESLVSASFLGARDPQGAAAMERIDPRFPNLIGDDFFSQQEFNLEQAAMLEPDLIIAGARSAWVDTAEPLDIPVFLMEAETPQQLMEAVLQIGQLFGPHSHAQAQAWVEYYDWVIDTVQNQLSEIPADEKPRILFTGTNPLRIASGDMYQTDIIESAGGFSVSNELSGYWNDINLEQVAIWNPDIIIVPPYGGASVEAITESPEWQIINAVTQNQVYRMPKLVVPWDTPAPDSVLGIIWMAELINPSKITLSCSVETEFFYNTFYNYAISGDEIAAICAFD